MQFTREEARRYLRGQIGDYLLGTDLTEYRGQGQRKNILCPNPEHYDINPSATYYPQSQCVYCHTCGKSWDIFDLVGFEYRLPDYNSQLLKACELYGIELVSSRSTAAHDFADLARAANGGGQQPEAESEPEREEPLVDYGDYIGAAAARLGDTDYYRGISVGTLRRFCVGFDPAWRHPSPNVPPTVPPSPRLIIPASEYGYLARATDRRTEYSKQRVGRMSLFNAEALHTATKPLFIVEGELDALSIIDAGGEALALCSVSLVNRLVEELKRVTPTAPLVVALDNDSAGQKAAEKLLDAELPCRPLFYRLPADAWGEHKDANAALMADRDRFVAAVRSAEASAVGENTKWDETSAAWYIQNQLDTDILNFKRFAYRKTGFSNLDSIINAVYPGLYVLGAISALGKTTLVHQICDQMAAKGEHVLFFSLEMSRLELVAKSLARRATAKTGRDSYVGALKIRSGALFPDEFDAVNSAKRELMSELTTFQIIEGNFGMTVERICETVKEYCATRKVSPVVVVDYLQVLPNTSAGGEREGVNHNVEALKLLSRDCNCPVIVISAFNRANYTVPVSYESFKESGGIEYTADVVMGLQVAEMSRDKTFDSSDPTKKGTKQAKIREALKAIPREIELQVLKNRNGRANQSCFFRYYPHIDTFEEAADLAKEPPRADSSTRALPPSEPPKEMVVTLTEYRQEWLPSAEEVAAAEMLD